MKKLLIITLSVAAMSLTGCVSIFKGTSQNITISSEPSGAQVLIDGMPMGVTPFSGPLKKNAYNSIMLKKDGYETQIRQLNKTYDPLALLNIFWDYSTTDFLTGAAFEYQPGTYHFNLEKSSAKWLTQDLSKKQYLDFLLKFNYEITTDCLVGHGVYLDQLNRIVEKLSIKNENVDFCELYKKNEIYKIPEIIEKKGL